MMSLWFYVRNFLLCLLVVLSFSVVVLNIIATARCTSRLSAPIKLSQKMKKINTILNITNCFDRSLKSSIEQHGKYWALINYVQASDQFKCYESITYTTQSDYTFLDNIIPLVQRWNGPISVALHAPGTDFQNTLSSIAYLRNCLNTSDIIRKSVSFHIFFPTDHIPLYLQQNIASLKNMYRDDFDCGTVPPFAENGNNTLYRTEPKLIYPINVARNIARINAQTHFILASDIELYPSQNLISKFFRMVEARKELLFQDEQRKVFVLPVFEVLSNQPVPENKTVLQKMMTKKTAFYFHKHTCSECHTIPNETEWLDLGESEKLNVFIETKRQGRYQKWEPFYIGTHEEPLFDERLSWEGQSNKMSQGFAMCLLDYDYLILDNAFLTHKPGVKLRRIQKERYKSNILTTNTLIKKYIKPQLEHFYGKNDKCKL